MSIEQHYNLTVTVKRASYTVDSGGGKVKTFATVGSSSGRARNLSGSEVEKLGRDSGRIWLRIYSSGSYTPMPLDTVTISGSDGGYDGNYEIRRVNAPQTSQIRHHWELDAVKYE